MLLLLMKQMVLFRYSITLLLLYPSQQGDNLQVRLNSIKYGIN